MNGVAALRQRLRQRRFPPEFRITGVVPPAPEPEPEPVVPQQQQQQQQPPPSPGPVEPPDAAMADLATSLWRLDRKLAEGGQPGNAGQRRAARLLRGARDALAKAGVEARDHDGMAFDPGLSLDVLSYQPTPGATRQTVLETIRPSVFRDGRGIQTGQVIVARPEEPEEPEGPEGQATQEGHEGEADHDA